MSSRSLNKVMLIGNLTRDPNLRFTPNNTAVCSFGLATNRTWSSDGGDKQESVEFHNIVAWSKLAEICGQLLHKGDKVYVDGRLQTRSWQGDDGVERRTTEVVIDNMIMLRSSGPGYSSGDSQDTDDNYGENGGGTNYSKPAQPKKKAAAKSKSATPSSDPDPVDAVEVTQAEDIADDIPF
ncbi:MAG TPA: single-stranded DNA-binding protein [Candidatus Woesebacteria bacterium]|nr:single-stranded DNA-binding protein [Candidatus Woesebacteria bacterium]